MEDWLDEYIIQLSAKKQPLIDPVTEALETVRAQLTSLQSQQDMICEYLEKGVYPKLPR